MEKVTFDDKGRPTTLFFVPNILVLEPSPSFEERQRVLLAIFFETGGSEDGLKIADIWGREAEGYSSIQGMKERWSFFKSVQEDPPLNVRKLLKKFKANRKG